MAGSHGSNDAPSAAGERPPGEAGGSGERDSQRRPPATGEEEVRTAAEPRDADLVAAALAAGDASAVFEALVHRYHAAVFKIAWYKSGNRADAEDLCQDIFLAAYRALPSLKDPESFPGWLMGIAHNRCHKWFRRQQATVLKFKEIGTLRAREQRLAAREAGESVRDRDSRLSAELDRLSPEIRSVLVLKYLEGLSYDAIEQRLGIKAYRIDYLIRKGKSLLRKEMRRKEVR